MIRKGRTGPVGIGYIFEFYKSNLRLSLFVPNFNAISDETGVIDQSYLLLLKLLLLLSLWEARMSMSRRNYKESHIPQIGYMEFKNAAHSCRPFPLFPSSAAPR